MQIFEGTVQAASPSVIHLPLRLRQNRDIALAQPDLPKDIFRDIGNDYERILHLVFTYHHLTTREEKNEFQKEHAQETVYLHRMIQPI